LTYNKKVIQSQQPTTWTFVDCVCGGTNPIQDWYENDLSEEAQDLFDALLKNISKTEQHTNWTGFRRFLKGEQVQKQRIWELEFRADKRQYRVLCKFGTKRKEIILLMGCYHKQSVYTPADAIDQATKRAKKLSEGEAYTCERAIEENI
jgi:phage-related protein